MRLYVMPGSGNSYKVRLLASVLNLEIEEIAMSALDGSTRTDDYLNKNPIGKLPLLQLDDGRYLPESAAILYYLSQETMYWPQESFAQAQVISWMTFEQYSHEPAIAVRRSLLVYPERASGATPEMLASLLEKGHAALKVMENQLSDSQYLVSDQPTIADIALFGYTHDCHRGEFSLDQYPGIRAWLKRIRTLPNFIEMSAA